MPLWDTSLSLLTHVVLIFFFKKHKNIFAFSIISRHSNATGYWNSLTGKTKIFTLQARMAWWHKEPGHQQPWYWSSFLYFSLSNRSVNAQSNTICDTIVSLSSTALSDWVIILLKLKKLICLKWIQLKSNMPFLLKQWWHNRNWVSNADADALVLYSTSASAATLLTNNWLKVKTFWIVKSGLCIRQSNSGNIQIQYSN